MSDEALPVSLEAELDAYFAQYPGAGQSPGLVYGLIDADGLAHSAGFGTANDDGLVPDADTMFPIASMTKSFTACAALIARDRGLLSLDDPITAYIPQFTAAGAMDDPCEPPTVGMLLSMSGGLTEDNSWVDPFIDSSEEELLAHVAAGLRYSTQPGTSYEYSNVGYALAGIAVGRAVGASIEDWVSREVLDPLGLTGTAFDSRAGDDRARATGYSLDPEGRWVPFAPVASAAFASAGGLMSTVRDLARWVTWLGSAYRPARPHDGDGVDILSRASRRELQRIHALDRPVLVREGTGGFAFTTAGYALGLRVADDLHRGVVVSHSGGLPGFILHMCWHPDSGRGMVVLTNSHRGDPVSLCTNALSRALSREDVPASTVTLWPETVALRADVDRLLRGWDDTLADTVLAENVAFDRSLEERRADVERLVAEVGPLLPPRPAADIVSAATAADVTWSIPGERGELLCMIHLTPVSPARVQELVVRAVRYDAPRATRPGDISARRARLGPVHVTPATNVRVRFPEGS